jgi:hypothetical protein
MSKIITLMTTDSLPETFAQTSNEPYIRHDYKVHYTNKKPEIFDNYEDVQRTWFQTASQFLDYIEVLDKKQPKNKKAKGF